MDTLWFLCEILNVNHTPAHYCIRATVGSVDSCTRAESKAGARGSEVDPCTCMCPGMPFTEERAALTGGLQPGKQEDDASSGNFKISSLKSMNLDRTWSSNSAKERKVQNIIGKRKQSEVPGLGVLGFSSDAGSPARGILL